MNSAYASNPAQDRWPRYVCKMATGSGKTKVMSLAIVWSYFNARLEPERRGDYTQTFALIAPNVIVYQRLLDDFPRRRDLPPRPAHPEVVAGRLEPFGRHARRPVHVDDAGHALPDQHPPALRVARSDDAAVSSRPRSAPSWVARRRVGTTAQASRCGARSPRAVN